MAAILTRENVENKPKIRKRRREKKKEENKQLS